MNALNNVVDHFVLVESTQTFQGKPKPLYFSENQSRYEKFKEKIIYLVHEFDLNVDNYSAWQREEAQRNELFKVWKSCREEDIILLSDVDEIPNSDLIKKELHRKSISIFRQRNFYHYINCRCKSLSETWWHGTVMFSAKYIKRPQDIRKIVAKLNRPPKRGIRSWVQKVINPIKSIFNKVEVVHDGGWHFGFIGGEKMIIEKIEAFSHVEYNENRFKNPEQIVKLIDSGKDLFGRELTYQFVPIDHTFPKFLIANRASYAHLIHNDSCS